MIFNMKAEKNSWSVTFYGEDEADREALVSILRSAKERGIPFGSVSIISLPHPRKVDDPPPPPFIWFPHFDEEDARPLLSAAGFASESLIFEEPVFEDLPKPKMPAYA